MNKRRKPELIRLIDKKTNSFLRSDYGNTRDAIEESFLEGIQYALTKTTRFLKSNLKEAEDYLDADLIGEDDDE